MKEKVISKDRTTGLMLTRDAQDPPRFYLRLNGRRELISIGDAALAVSQFSREARRLKSLRRPQWASAAATNVIPFPHRLPDMPNGMASGPEVSNAA